MSKTKLSEFISDYGDGIHGTPTYSDNGEYYFINGNNLDNGNIIIDSDVLKVDALEYEKIKRPLTDRTVLLSINGSLGKTAFYRGEKVALGKSACYINIKDEYSKEFFRYILTTKEFQKYMLQVAHGSTIKNFAPSQVGDYEVDLPDKEDQEAIALFLSSIDAKIQNNNDICFDLESMAKLLYNFWFVQFDFPDENGYPYKSSGGKMVWNDTLDREIPEGWCVGNIVDNPLSNIISVGIDYFESKNYLPTANVVGENITDGEWITYENRETRANMQPTAYSVWFAKMKNSIKHISIPEKSDWFTSKYILSTGFEGIQCKEETFGYIHCVVNSDYFEKHKDIVAHGATQESVNDDDLRNIKFAIPTNELLKLFSKIINPILESKFALIEENQELVSLRDFLLPMLMNGQVKVGL